MTTSTSTFSPLHFCASVQIGTRIKGYGGQIMVVTEVTKRGFKGYNEYCMKKFNKKTEVQLAFDTITNGHYNRSLTILPA